MKGDSEGWWVNLLVMKWNKKKHEDIKYSEENKDRNEEEIEWSRGLTYSKEFENAVEKYQLKDVVFLKTHIDDTEV